MSKAPINVCLVGAGRMGQIRAKIIYANPRMSLSYVVDGYAPCGETLARELHSTYVPSFEEALQKEADKGGKIDVVFVCVHTSAHAAIIELAAKNGIHIFTEKPVCETPEEITKIFEITRKHDVHLCCGFQRRFDSSYRAVQNRIKNGDIGDCQMARVFFADHPCPSLDFLMKGGDPFMDLAPHDVDYLMWVLDDVPDEIYAIGSSTHPKLQENNIIDTATVCIKFKKGTMATLMMSRSATYGYDQRCEFFGSKGLCSVDNIHMHTGVIHDVNGSTQSTLMHSFPERFYDAFKNEVDALCDTVQNGTPWPIGELQCIVAQAVAMCASDSCAQGGKPLKFVCPEASQK